MYRSQLLLQQLGIQQWIPKQQVTQKMTADILWADQTVDPNMFAAGLPVQAPVVALNTSIQSAPVALKQPIADTHVVTEPNQVVHQEQAVQVQIQEPEYPQDIHLNYQIITHEQFILLAEVNNDQEQTLLDNICKACHADSFFLQWPLPLETWDMNDFVVESYLHGVFAVHQNKKWFSLGEVNTQAFKVLNHQFKIYASLKQLLESPIEKKALWSGLSPLIYDTEQENA